MGGRTRAVVATLGVVGILVAVALGPPTVSAAGGEGPVVVGVGSGSPVEFQFGFTPRQLPSGSGGVTRLKLGLEETPFSEGIPPGIATTTIDLDRSIALEPRGLPVCWKPGVEGGIQVDAAGSDECDRAVVGRVEATIDVAYPENTPISVPGKGKIYSGGIREGGTNLLLEIPVAGPLNGILWLVAKVRPVHSGRTGSEMTIEVPTIAAGYGSLTDLHLELGRDFGRDGERIGYVQAKCQEGKLVATQSTRLTDGTEGHSESIRACTSRHG